MNESEEYFLKIFIDLQPARGESMGGVLPTTAIIAHIKDVVGLSGDELSRAYRIVRALDIEFLKSKPQKTHKK